MATNDRQKQPSIIGKIMYWAGAKKHYMITALALAAVAAILMVIPYYYYYLIAKTAIDGYINQSFDVPLITRYSLMAIGFIVLNFITYFSALMCSHYCAFNVRNNMVKQCMSHLQQLPIGYHIHHPSGKIRKVVEQNSAMTESYIAHSLPDFVQALITPVVLILFLLYFDWRLGLACLAPVVLALVIQMTLMGNPEHRALMMKKYQDAQEDINHAAVEYVRGVSVVKVFNQTVYSFKNFHRAIVDFKENLLQWSLDFEPSYRIFLTAINAIFVILVPVFIILYNNASSPLNLVMSFIFYVIIMPIIGSAILKVTYMGSFQAQTLESLARIEGILSTAPPEEPANPKLPDDYDVVFEDVSFRYQDAEHWALKDFSCKIEKGKVTALVGKSGSGKTTIANLMMSFYRPGRGRITIGGIDVDEIGSAQIMDMVSYVFQENKLLKMSILDNVRVAKPDATEADVVAAMEKAQCADIIDHLPNGLATHYGQKGVYLSGGEIQRVAIARALLKDAPIVVLDEATAFTDPENEHKIKLAFDELLKDKTVLMIAHRLSSIADADKIIVMSEGELVEQGRHAELVAKEERYAQMWREFNRSINWTFGSALASAETIRG